MRGIAGRDFDEHENESGDDGQTENPGCSPGETVAVIVAVSGMRVDVH